MGLADNNYLPQLFSVQFRTQPEGLFEMQKFANSVKKFLVSEDGPTAVEYAVMLALIIVVCLAAISTIGSSANSKFQEVGNYLT